ncbi:ABC transporter ATP-binding protein [Castellaniella sp.]|uniref:ABC transporter ATP-binding protein n=1 Tax=Castellaniella sp. TaxID=1955812 RepID=UPI003560A681
MSTQSLLQVQGITKHFGGLMALDDVSFTVAPGEIVGLIGPNGSGKSTLVNILTGLLVPSSGRVLLDGQQISGRPSWQIARMGVARTFQMLRLFPALSVARNIALAMQHALPSGDLASVLRLPSARADDVRTREKALEMLALFGLERFIDQPAAALSIGQQRMVELARGLATSPRVFLLDEPAAGLSPPNVDKLIEVVSTMRAQYGVTVLLVEHVMRVVQAVCDRVVVLDYGRKIADAPPAEATTDPRVVEAYIGLGRARHA